jgi:hypothetical protein
MRTRQRVQRQQGCCNVSFPGCQLPAVGGDGHGWHDLRQPCSELPSRTLRHGRAPPPWGSAHRPSRGARTRRHSPEETVPRMERPERGSAWVDWRRWGRTVFQLPSTPRWFLAVGSYLYGRFLGSKARSTCWSRFPLPGHTAPSGAEQAECSRTFACAPCETVVLWCT